MNISVRNVTDFIPVHSIQMPVDESRSKRMLLEETFTAVYRNLFGHMVR